MPRVPLRKLSLGVEKPVGAARPKSREGEVAVPTGLLENKFMPTKFVVSISRRNRAQQTTRRIRAAVLVMPHTAGFQDIAHAIGHGEPLQHSAKRLEPDVHPSGLTSRAYAAEVAGVVTEAPLEAVKHASELR